MSTVAATAARHKLRDLGYDPLPCRGKAPTSVKGWQDKFDTSRDEIDLWGKLYEYDENTGVLTKFTPTLDVDITFQPAAEAVREFLEEHFSERGYVMVRTGRAPKFAVLFRTDEPFTKLKRQFTAQNDTTHALEFLGDGQQVIVDGIHPDTGKAYAWFKGSPLDIAHGDIPYIRRDDAVALLDALGALLIGEFGFKPVEQEAKPNGAGGPAGEHGAAVWGSLVASILAGAGLHDSLLQGANSLLGQGSNRAGAIRTLQGILENATCPHDARWQDRYNDIPRLVRDAAEKQGKGKEEAPEGVSQLVGGKSEIEIVAPFPIDATRIPPRPWIVPGLLLRKNLSVLVAPPGSGKSLLTIQIALMCASGLMGWAGWKCPKKYRVLIVNVEEDADEMKRRLFAAALSMGIDHADLDGIFFANADSIVVARMDAKTKTVMTTPVYGEIIDIIKQHQIDVCVVDPFAETFDVQENSNSEVKWAAVLWRGVARETSCSVFLVHHTKKYASNMAGDPDAGRGGGVVIGVARVMTTLFGMTAEEAKCMEMEEDDRIKYVRFDDAKANMNLVSPRAKWFMKKTITLDNGDGDTPPDEVGVLVPWTPPSVFDGLDNHNVHEILDELERGLRTEDGRPTGEWYGLSSKGGSRRWAGIIIKGRLACSDQDAHKILKMWLKTGMIEEVDEYSKNGKRTVKRIVVRTRPGVTDEVAFGD